MASKCQGFSVRPPAFRLSRVGLLLHLHRHTPVVHVTPSVCLQLSEAYSMKLAARVGTSGIDVELGLSRRFSPSTVLYAGTVLGYSSGTQVCPLLLAGAVCVCVWGGESGSRRAERLCPQTCAMAALCPWPNREHVCALARLLCCPVHMHVCVPLCSSSCATAGRARCLSFPSC